MYVCIYIYIYMSTQANLFLDLAAPGPLQAAVGRYRAALPATNNRMIIMIYNDI